MFDHALTFLGFLFLFMVIQTIHALACPQEVNKQGLPQAVCLAMGSFAILLELDRSLELGRGRNRQTGAKPWPRAQPGSPHPSLSHPPLAEYLQELIEKCAQHCSSPCNGFSFMSISDDSHVCMIQQEGTCCPGDPETFHEVPPNARDVNVRTFYRSNAC